MTTDNDLVRVEVQTNDGKFVLGIDEARAPITARNFLDYVDGGHLNGSTVYRIVTMANQKPETVHKIEVIQWGWRPTDDAQEQPFPSIAHEPTSLTGLKHTDGTISMARFGVGTAGPGFFICVGDQPELDEGGRRNPDGHGFAAFGKVLEGQDTIAKLFARAEADEYPITPLPISSVRRA